MTMMRVVMMAVITSEDGGNSTLGDACLAHA